MLKLLVRSAILHAKSHIYSAKLRRLPSRYTKDVPYFSQWESRGLNATILCGEIEAKDDPMWRSSGAESKTEYAEWSWNGCGMACLKMVLAHHINETFPLVILGKQSLKYDCYDLPLEDSIGLKYKSFTRFLKADFAIPARVEIALPTEQIVYELARDNYVMASVSPLIRDVTSRPKIKGGHVVLIVGYDLSSEAFYLHNPSGDSRKSQEFAEVSFVDFARFFSGRGVVMSPKTLLPLYKSDQLPSLSKFVL